MSFTMTDSLRQLDGGQAEMAFDRANYELSYTGELTFGEDLSVLGKLWEQFNINHPADYQRRSMSIRDIVAHQAEKVDGIGVQRLTIHDNCVGVITIRENSPLPMPDITVNTRKGVYVSYPPDSKVG